MGKPRAIVAGFLKVFLFLIFGKNAGALGGDALERWGAGGPWNERRKGGRKAEKPKPSQHRVG